MKKKNRQVSCKATINNKDPQQLLGVNATTQSDPSLQLYVWIDTAQCTNK